MGFDMQRNDLDVYGALAEVHDLMYPGGEEVAGVVEFVASVTPPPGRLIEFGPGCGRLAIPLAERGYEVHGVEGSRAMIDKLRSRDPEGRVRVSYGDFSDIVVGGEFDVCLVACNTLFMLPTSALQRRALEHARKQLASDGRLVLELYEPSSFHSLTGAAFQVRPLEGTRVMIDTVSVDPASQVMVQVHSLIEDGRVINVPELSRYAWPTELDLMAELSGFELVERWADWRRTPFGQNSPRHISVYRPVG
jgi:SAM-dependent methyltransferase